MKHSHEEIINALKILKTTCLEQETCKNCPFCDNKTEEDCLLQKFTPMDYYIHEEETVWRALQ